MRLTPEQRQGAKDEALLRLNEIILEEKAITDRLLDALVACKRAGALRRGAQMCRDLLGVEPLIKVRKGEKRAATRQGLRRRRVDGRNGHA